MEGWMDTHPCLALAHKHSKVPDPRLGCTGYTCGIDAIQRQLCSYFSFFTCFLIVSFLLDITGCAALPGKLNTLGLR